MKQAHAKAQEQASPSHIPLRNILYATDFSKQSNAAMPYALSIARKYGSTLFVVHVISLSPFPHSSPTIALQAMADQAAREARASVEALQPQLKDVPHEMLIRKGDIWSEIGAVVGEKKIDLVIVGTHGRTRVSKVLMGSVAEKIFRHATCPVLTVGPNVCGEPDSIVDLHCILCPTDFSAESLAAIPYAVSLAEEDQARLYLLHVTENPSDKATEAALTQKLAQAVPAAARLSCQPKAYVDSGSAPERILSLAEELAVDLIVLGVKRTPRIPGGTRLAMATSYKVVTEALCPVLTVRG
jgi:nucleotide-binding universal stress UspA family protein